METQEQIEERAARNAKVIDEINSKITILRKRSLRLRIFNWLLLFLNFYFLGYHSNMLMVEAYAHKLEWPRLLVVVLLAFTVGFSVSGLLFRKIQCSTK